MCKTKMSTQVIQQNPTPRIPRSSQSPRTSKPSSSSMSGPSTSSTTTANYTSVTGSSYKDSSATSASSKSSLSSLRESLPENAHIYDFTEIRSATNNFLAKRFSSSSSPSWRCSIRGKDVIVFQRKLRRSIEQLQLRERLSLICRSHHTSIIKLLGVSISGSHIYLVYDFVNGANLADCLRNSKNPNFTVLSNWISRMQIVSDVAHGLDYIHNSTGLKLNLIHNHIKSNSIIVTEPSFNAKLCHFGTAELCGEIAIENPQNLPSSKSEIIEISEESSSPSSSTSMKSSNLKKSDSLAKKFEGTRGYMSPEFTSTGIATQKSDVYAFGVVILEILSGEEPLKFRFDKEKKEITKISVIETAREAMEYDDEGIESGRLRRWIDRRLKDSFPVDVAMKLTRIALDCVDVDVDKRPNMRRVAGKISKLYLESGDWMVKMKAPVDFSVSLAPR